MTAIAPALLEVSDLCARYGRIPVLNGASFVVGTGEVVGILGHNGMGKTTLLRTVMGFIAPAAGRITLDGRDLTRAPVHSRATRGIGYVPQGREIFPQLSVAENLAIASDDRAVVERVLADFPILKPLLDRPGGALSGGEQQVLALARCLCTQPRLVLLDEPTEGIQPSIVESIGATLESLNRRSGLSLVVVEQNLEFVAELADRVLIIQKGAIVAEVEPDALHGSALLDEFVGVKA